ncbi:hypothetical protein K2X33_03395 [bacterium]|nr:hypothetical protein [bacterium]
MRSLLGLFFLSFPSFGEFGTPLRPPSFSGHIVFRAVASQPSNTTSYLAVGRAWTGSNYQGIISSILVDGGWRDGSFSKGNTAWYPGQKFIDFAGAGFDNLCNAVTYAYDGYIVACRSMKSNGYYDIYLAKVSATGTLDTSFGTSGIVTTGIAGNSTDGHGFVRGIAYNSAVNTSHNGVVTIVGSVGTNSSNYRPFAASFDQQTGAAWGSKTTVTDYAGTAVAVLYDSTTSNAYYIAATESVAPHHIYIHKYTYSSSADTSLDAAASPWGSALSLSAAGGGAETIPTGIALGTTGAWGVDIIVGGSNKTSSSSGNWVCTTVAVASSTGNLRTSYGDAGTDNLGVTLLTHDASHDCILNSVTNIGSGQIAAIGAAYTSGNANYDQLVLKLDTNGTAVSGFGTSGFKIVANGPANDVTNSAVKIGSYLYAGGRVDNASLYQGGDVQRYDITAGTVAPAVSTMTANSPTISSGQGVGLTITATYADGSTASVPLSSVNLSTSNSSVINLNGSSPYVYSTAGASTPTITAVLDENLSITSTVDISVPGYTTTNLRGDYDAAYSSGYGPSSSSATTWYDLTTNNYDGTTSGSSHAYFSGSGTYSSPYMLLLDGQGNISYGTSPLASQTKGMFSTWIRASNASTATDRVILGNSSNGAGNGFTLRHRASYRDAMLALSPVGYWRLGDTSGTSASDLGSGGNTGTYTNGPTLNQTSGVTGEANTSVLLDGSNDYISFGNAAALKATSAFSVALWFKYVSTTGGTVLVSRTGATGNDNFSLYNSSGTILFGARKNDGSTWLQTSSVTLTDTSNWHFVVGTYDGSTLRLYLDGVLASSYNGTFTIYSTMAGNLQVGAGSVTPNQFLSGYVDEFAFFNSALTQAQIASLHLAGTRGKTMDLVVGPSLETAILADSPVGYWRLGESSGTTAKEFSGNGLNGTYTNSPTLGATGATAGDTAVTFDGSNDYVAVAHSTTLTPTSEVSLEAIVKYTTTSLQVVVQKYLGSTPYPGYVMAVNNGKVGCQFGSSGTYTYSATTKNDGNYHHVVCTLNSSNLLTVYVDGTSSNSATVTPSLSNTVTLSIGSYNAAGNFFTGTIQDVAVYSTALSSTRVAAHYAAIGAANGGICRSTSNLSENLWTHVSGIFSGSAATLYVNGRQECTVSVSGGFASPNSALYAGATNSNTKNYTGYISDLKVYGTSNGSAVGASTDIKTNFDYTADTYRANAVGDITTSNLVLNLDPANAKQGLRPYSNGCYSSDTSWFELTSSAATGTLNGFSSCGSTTGWNGDGTRTISSTAGPYRLTFDGSNDYVSLGSTNYIGTGTTPMTVQMWAYINSITNNTAQVMVRLNQSTEYVSGFYKNSGNTYLLASFRGQTQNWPIITESLYTGRWINLTFAYTGGNKDTASSFKFYLNGTQVTSTQTNFGTAGGSGNINELGRDTSASYMNGEMGPVLIYNKELSQSEIYANFIAHADRFRKTSAGNIVTSGLILNLDAANGTTLAYQGNGCGITDWFDISSTLTKGTLTNFASCGASTGWNGDGTTTVSGTNGPYRLTFDGTNDLVSVPTSSTLSPTTGITIESWVYPTDITSYRTIACKQTNSGWTTPYADYCLRTQAGDVQFWVRYAGSSVLMNTATISANAWTHIVGTYNGSYRRVYVNGTLVKSDAVTGSIDTSGQQLTIGSQGGGAAAGSYFLGSIAKTAIYNRALSASEISQNCNALKARFNGATCN